MDYEIVDGKLILDSLTVDGSLNLRNTNIVELPDNLSVEGYLDLSKTNISKLPDNLSVGGYLYLENTKITNYPVVYDCGVLNRVIYLDLEDKRYINIGCFKGTKDEAIESVKEKYNGKDQEDYIAKIEECFSMYQS